MLLTFFQVVQKTRTVHTPNPVWNQTFEFDEIGGGEYLKIKGFSEEIFGDENIGSGVDDNSDDIVDYNQW